VKKLKKKTYAGINIQFPISKLILSGEKTIETRTYPIPEKYIGKEMLMIETPGKVGKFRARIVAIIKFEDSFQYTNKWEFYKDQSRHKVTQNSTWAWTRAKKKWGWPVRVVKKLKMPIAITKRIGIKYTNEIAL
jgi:hypothetical protein